MKFYEFLLVAVFYFQALTLMYCGVLFIWTRKVHKDIQACLRLLELTRTYTPIPERGTVKPWDGFDETIKRMREGGHNGIR